MVGSRSVRAGGRRIHLAAGGLGWIATMAIGAAMLGVPGCIDLFQNGLAEGTYNGDLACTIEVVDPDGQEATEDFTASTTLTAGSDGSLAINDEPITSGAEVTREIPNAELAFEVADVRVEIGRLVIRYEPRPTLPGITVEGELVETYRQQLGSVAASADADLTVTDATGESTITIRCTGVLPRQ